MIFFCQSTDEAEALTSHAINIIKAFESAGVDLRAVFSLRVGSHSSVAAPVYHLKGNKLRRFFLLYYYILTYHRDEKLYFFYQNGYYVPSLFIMKLVRVKFFQWISHPTPSLRSYISSKICDTIFTVNKNTFPYVTENVCQVGLSISSAFLEHNDESRVETKVTSCFPDEPYALYVGRISQSKNIGDIIRHGDQSSFVSGVKLLVIAGSTQCLSDRKYMKKLDKIIRSEVKNINIIFFGSVTTQIARVLYQNCHHSYCFSDTATDKTLYECLSMGRPVICSNWRFYDHLCELDLRFLYSESRGFDEHSFKKVFLQWNHTKSVEIKNHIRATMNVNSLILRMLNNINES